MCCRPSPRESRFRESTDRFPSVRPVPRSRSRTGPRAARPPGSRVDRRGTGVARRGRRVAHGVMRWSGTFYVRPMSMNDVAPRAPGRSYLCGQMRTAGEGSGRSGRPCPVHPSPAAAQLTEKSTGVRLLLQEPRLPFTLRDRRTSSTRSRRSGSAGRSGGAGGDDRLLRLEPSETIRTARAGGGCAGGSRAPSPASPRWGGR